MHRKTRATYDNSAKHLSDHYDKIGAREGDINLAFALAGNPENAMVLEIGSGNGRDARAILRRTPYYTGIDTSQAMVQMAKKRAPKGQFFVADAVAYDYNGPYDIIFALAQFRHMNLAEATTVLKKVYNSLRSGGIVYVSSNHADKYHCKTRVDEFGSRDIYYYNPDILQKHAPPGLKKVQELYDMVDDQQWFEVAFQKTP